MYRPLRSVRKRIGQNSANSEWVGGVDGVKDFVKCVSVRFEKRWVSEILWSATKQCGVGDFRDGQMMLATWQGDKVRGARWMRTRSGVVFYVGFVLRRRRFDLVVSSLHLCQLTGPEDFLNDCDIPSLPAWINVLINFRWPITYNSLNFILNSITLNFLIFCHIKSFIKLTIFIYDKI